MAGWNRSRLAAAWLATTTFLAPPATGSLSPQEETAPASVGRSLPNTAPVVAEVAVAGLVDLEPPLVRLMVATKVGVPFDQKTLRADEQILLDSGMFRSVRSEVQPQDPGGVRVLLRLQEAPPVRSVQVSGSREIDGEKLAATCRDLVRGVPRPSEIDAVSREVATSYTDAGLFACGLRAEAPLTLSAEGDLTIHVSEPKLGRVWVVGNARVQERHILRRLGLRPGVVVRSQHLEDAVKRLAGLGTIAAARFEIERLSKDEKEVHLRLVVREEEYFGNIEIGARYEQVNGAVASVTMRRRGLFDSGWYSQLEVEAGQRQSYSGKLGSDWLLGLPVTGEAGLYSLETRREARDRGRIVSRLVERRTGGSVRLTKTLRHGARLRAGFRDENVRAMAEDGFLLPTNLATIGGSSLRADYPVQTLEFTWAEGPDVVPLTPETPNAWRIDLERAGGDWLKGPGDYTTLRLEGRRLLSLGPKSQLALRARAGAILLADGTLPFLERLSVGGSETLRGLPFKDRTGDRMLFTNVEFRRHLSSRVTGVAFLDWGDAWEHDARDLDGSLSLGLGARVDISLFQLRLDFAHELDGEGVRFAFGVGQLF